VQDHGPTDLVTCTLEPPDEHWRPVPFPGGEEARMMGCTCPIEKDQPWPGKLIFAISCPVHVMEIATKQ
jgi:hypothetical protein